MQAVVLLPVLLLQYQLPAQLLMCCLLPLLLLLLPPGTHKQQLLH